MDLSTNDLEARSAPDAPARESLPGWVLSVLLLVAASAPLAAFDGDHDHDEFTHPVTTSSAQAQKQFDRGLLLAWGFNHQQAARAFREAAQLDPECGMCFWGVALVLGPNINAPLDPQYYPQILEALAKAKELAPKGTEAEQAYIRALAERYGPEPVEDRSALDKAYADAMRRVAYARPDDLTAAVLYSEALMDTTPWDYWLPDGEPKEVTEEFIRVLEGVLRRDPDHPGAAHLLIHAVEKARPDLGVPAADMLAENPQATGHLVHMASHIYLRVGRYEDSARVNAKAIADDDAYAASHEVPLEYVPYMLHNHHMRWASLLLDGRGEEAAKQARLLRERVPAEALANPALAFLQHFWAVPLFDRVTFEDWDAVLAEPEPARELVYSRGLWHWAQGVARAREGESAAAREHLAALTAIAADEQLDELGWGLNPGRTLLEIGREQLAGEVAAAAGDLAGAIAHLERAVEREEALVYDEPPPWLGSVRHALARAQLAAGEPKRAESTLRADLDVYPHNGWAIGGLVRALEAQGKREEAAQARDRLAEVWARSDVALD